jgi:hypothetical protein
MMRIEERLIKELHEVLANGVGMKQPIAEAVRKAFERNCISFSLQSKHGPLIDKGSKTSLPYAVSWQQSVFQTLATDRNDTKRFVFSISPGSWDIISFFMINRSAFYAILILDEPESMEECLRAGIMKVLDFLCARCHCILADYMKQLLLPIDPAGKSGRVHAGEMHVLERIAEFSSTVNYITLIDSDGFIVSTYGNVDEVEKVAGNAALFHQRCVRELSFRGDAAIQSEAFSCKGHTVLIGQIEHTPLSLAISTDGRYARSFASFLFELAHDALMTIAHETGKLLGSPIEPIREPGRIRTSWFNTAQLIAKGKYVGKQGAKAFHVAACKSLLKSDDTCLLWYEKRSDAIHAGFIPCKLCNP